MWKLNNTLLKIQWINEEIKKEIINYLEANENKNTIFQKSMGCLNVTKRKASKREYKQYKATLRSKKNIN